MPLTLYYHPLASFCWKPLIALYEHNISFTPVLVDLMNDESRGEFLKLWPMGQFPVLKDDATGKIIPQSTSIIEYLMLRYRNGTPLIPEDPDAALEVRRWNEFFDTYLQAPMQKIVGDCLRPQNAKDPTGVNDARATINTAYNLLEQFINKKEWMVSGIFSLADCSAAPALFYANKVEPLGSHKFLNAYLARLMTRPSFSRVLKEAEPYFHLFPYKQVG